MMEELVIKAGETRFKDAGISFLVKERVEGEENMWWVLQTSLVGGGYWPKARRRSRANIIKLSEDRIRELHAQHVADSTINYMTTRGIQKSAMGAQKTIVVRNGKASSARIQEAMIRLRSGGIIRPCTS